MADANAKAPVVPDLPPVLYLIHCQDQDARKYAGVEVRATSPTNGPWSSFTNSEGDVVDPGTGLAGVTLGKGHYSVTFWQGGKQLLHDGSLAAAEWDLAWPPSKPILVGLTRVAPALPAVPARRDVCGLRNSIQGLTYRTAAYGPIPAWFYAGLGALDRAGARETHRQAGDTHVRIAVAEAYIEPSTLWPLELMIGYDYAYDLERLRALVLEAALDGMYVDMPLAGDGMSKSDHPGQGDYNDPQGNTYGWQWLMLNLERILLGLKGDGTPERPDLTPWILFRLGWDNVFYGWGIEGEVPDLQPTRVRQAGELFRRVLPLGHLAIEHTPGHIPCGEGGADYAPGGLMRNFDTILGEYGTCHEDACWQVLGRMLEVYVRPPDQPAGDDPESGRVPSVHWYLAPGNERGEYVYVAFEPTKNGAYEWARGRCSLGDVLATDRYLRNMGALYTGCSLGMAA